MLLKFSKSKSKSEKNSEKKRRKKNGKDDFCDRHTRHHNIFIVFTINILIIIDPAQEILPGEATFKFERVGKRHSPACEGGSQQRDSQVMMIKTLRKMT